MKKHIIYLVFILALVFSCREDEEVIDAPPIAVDSTLTVDLSGYVQKGPFINGTAITVSELDKKLVTTGKNFTTQIADNKGSFSLKGIKLKSNFVQLQADGFYFDEVKGEKSAAQLTLFALSDVEDVSSINANLLSHMERTRVIYLMQEEEKNFVEAKQQAQQEILTVFGIEKEDIQYSEVLDISRDGDDNAILLAISAVLQADNTVAELSELVANIITDLREDGELNSENSKNMLREQAMSLKLSEIRAHLEKRYADMGVEATISNFEQYIDSDGDGILNKDEDDTPEDFSFTLQQDVATKANVISNVVTLSGLKEGGTADAIVQHGQIILNGKLMEDSVTQVKNGDQLQLQLTSSDAYADTVSTKITIGTLFKNFTAITDDYIPDAFSFTAQKDVAIDSFYTSNTVTVSGIPYETPFKIDGGIIIKNGEELETDTTSVKNGDELAVKLLSSSEFKASSSALVDINGISASFSITTDDYSPDPFSFKEINNAKIKRKYISDTITVTGLPHPTPSGIAWFSTDDHETGAIYVNGVNYRNNGFSVKNGDKIWIEVTASEEFSTTLPSSLVINDKEAYFNLTTEQNPWQLVSTYPGKAIYFHSGFTLNDKIYVGTGYTFSPRTELNDFYEYNPQKNIWTKKANFKGHPRAMAIGLSTGGYGYIGLGEIDTDQMMEFSDIWKYDVTTDQWSLIPELPNADSYAKDFNVNDRAFIINRGNLLELKNDQWIQKNPIPSNVSYNTFLFSVNGKAYFTYDFYAGIYVYDTHTDSWDEINNPLYIDDMGFEINGLVYATKNWSDEWFCFNPSDNSWKGVDGFMDKSIPLKCFSVNGKGYCLTKRSSSNDALDFWEFTPPQE
ncbi:kelch repeat-containing protein [Catalinimonas sp. 4WD22]|uniref:Kelch repeat-containing protein n=1 Tax=Catalinimonas locisalis TaxID=3133978 RepID=UPI003100EFF1